MSETVKPTSETRPSAARAKAHANGAAPSAGGNDGGSGAVATSSAGATGEQSPADFLASLQQFLTAMLERQCRLVGAVAGVVYLAASGARPASIGAVYVLPEGETGGKNIPATARVQLDQAMVARLGRYAAEASTPPSGQARTELITLQAEGRSGAGIYQPDATHRVLACPLVAADQAHGASVVLVPAAVRIDPADGLERIALAGATYESFLWRNHCMSEAQTKTRLRETLELLDAAQQSEDAEAMGAIFCHELQRRFGCTRVSIGMMRAWRLRVVGVSGVDELNKHAAVVESLEQVMEECAEQDIEVVFPPPPEDEGDPSRRRVTRAHAQHSTRFGPSAMLSLPLRVSGDLVGVVTLERDPAAPFPAGAVPLLRLVAEFIGPAVWTRRMADRGVMAVTRDRAAEIAALTFGPRYTGVKAIAALVLIVFLLMALVPIPGRVSAETETRATVSRTISPPFEGFLESVSVKPGDRVTAGQVLATMDLNEARLQLEQENNHLLKLRTQQDEARSRGVAGQADAAVIEATMAETRGAIKLHENRIARGSITAPLTGEVSRGDIEPLAGAKVEPSQPLFEIIEPDKHVIVIRVKERDIGFVKEGQEGRLAITAVPDTKLPIKVARIRPVAEPVQRFNIYYVEAELDAAKVAEEGLDVGWLKPGMTGTARLDNGTTTVLWELCKPLVDAARMRLWW